MALHRQRAELTDEQIEVVAARVCKWILRNATAEPFFFDVRTCHQDVRRFRTDSGPYLCIEDVKRALDLLVQRVVIERAPNRLPLRGGRRPSPRFAVHDLARVRDHVEERAA